MEDDKTPASPRKRAAKAKPNDTSNPSAAADPTATGASKSPRPPKIPPATFVSPAAPSEKAADPAAPSQQAADTTPPSAAPPAASPAQARTSPDKVAKKAAQKAPAAAPPARNAPPTPGTLPLEPAPAAKRPTPPAPAVRATRAPAKKIAKRAAPETAALKKTAPATSAVPPQKIAEPAEPPAPAAPPTPPTPAELPAPPAPESSAPESSAPEPPSPAPRAEPPAPLWPAIKTNPAYSTELLALAAVEHLGPQARTDLAWLRATYPTATTHGLARIATSRSVRLTRTQGAVAGLLGPLAVLAETGALLWTQARLVLDIAAAYGRDPADPERAAELLVLQRVHPDLTAAGEAVTAAREAAANGPGACQDGGNLSPQVALPLLRLTGRALGRMTIARRAARLVPGAAAALTGILDGRATEQLAVRATKFYRR